MKHLQRKLMTNPTKAKPSLKEILYLITVNSFSIEQKFNLMFPDLWLVRLKLMFTFTNHMSITSVLNFFDLRTVIS
jgi:hypothetical protein